MVDRWASPKHSRVSTKLYYNRKKRRRSAATRIRNDANRHRPTRGPNARFRAHRRHDGCLYEAVIYFIIGGRGRYNPRLGNEAIYGERERRSDFLALALGSLPAAAASNREQKFDRIASRYLRLYRWRHPLFVPLSPRIEITAIVKRTYILDGSVHSFGRSTGTRVVTDSSFFSNVPLNRNNHRRPTIQGLHSLYDYSSSFLIHFAPASTITFLSRVS